MNGTYRILITGSRDWDDAAFLAGQLGRAVCDAQLQRRTPVIIHGACPTGADHLADEVARQHGDRVERHPADWATHKKRAGFIRNAEMVALGADVCLAFVAPCTKAGCQNGKPHGSHGATHCAVLAEKAGIPVRRYAPDA